MMRILAWRGLSAIVFCTIACVCASCYTQSILINGGAKGIQEETAQSWYLINGLANLSNTNIDGMAKGANSYTVTFQRTFVDGLIGSILSGLVTPETIVVKR
jgi:Bor protein